MENRFAIHVPEGRYRDWPMGIESLILLAKVIYYLFLAYAWCEKTSYFLEIVFNPKKGFFGKQ